MSIETQTDGPLSEAEFRVFTGLLRRFWQHELDQWENWRCRTSHGYVYITISRELPEAHPAEAYGEFPKADSDG